MALRYQYALTEVPFDSSYENVIRFDSREQQEEYFGVSTLFVNAPSIDFDFGNLVATSIVIKLDGNPMEVMGKNYLILKNNNENAKPKYMYWFVDNVEYLSGGNDESKTQAILHLSLDVFNTYLLDIEFGNGCVIRRASLNRWKKVGSNLRINFDEDSPFRIEDDTIVESPTLIETNRQSIVPLTSKDYSIKDDIVSWLNDNVSGWEYVYLDKNHEYKVNEYNGYNENDETLLLAKNDIGDYKYILNNNLYMSNLVDTITDYGSICIPIYKSTKKIYVRITCQGEKTNKGFIKQPCTIQYSIDGEGLNNFRDMNNDASYFFTRKISLVAPWSKLDNIKYHIDNKGNLILIGNSNGNIVVDKDDSTTSASYCGATLNPSQDTKTLTSITSQYSEDYLYSMIASDKNTLEHTKAYEWTPNYENSGSTNIVSVTKPTETQLNNFSYGTIHGVFVGLTQLNYKSLYTQEYSLSVPSYTTKEALVSLTSKRMDYCPKLYVAPYSSLKIQCYGEDLEYSPSDLWNGTTSDSKIRFMFNEILMPEITKFYLRPSPQGIYTDTYEYNLAGLVSTCDLSVAIVNNAYSEFIANNKNYWLQALASSMGGNNFESIASYFKKQTPYVSTTSSNYEKSYKHRFKGENLRLKDKLTSSRETTKISTGGQKSLGNIWMDVTKLGLDFGLNMANSALYVSNLKASPSTMKNATGNSYFLMSNKNLDIYCSEMKLLDIDKQRVYDYYYEYGYPLNKIGNLDDYINIRHYFNYLQADVQNIHGKNGVSIPNVVRSSIKELLSDGIRLWNVTDKMFQYDMENYENDL